MKKWMKLIIAIVAAVFTIFCCAYQFFYYSSFKRIDLSGLQICESVDYSIDEINYKDPDNDYIFGTLSMDGKAVTSYPTKLVLYLDDSDVAYAIPVKLSNISADGEVIDGADNEGLYADKTHFEVLLDRFSGLRNSYKIGFLIDRDGEKLLVKTGVMYKYSDI